MKITKSPQPVQEVIEIAEYPTAIVRRLKNRVDRILGGDPPPIEPIRTYMINGRMRWDEGEAMLEEGELIQFGVKFSKPVICDITGQQLHGLIPIEIEGRKVRFVVDCVTS